MTTALLVMSFCDIFKEEDIKTDWGSGGRAGRDVISRDG